MADAKRTVRLATRRSPLAIAQAESVRTAIEEASGGEVIAELVKLDSAGDKRRDVPIHVIGGDGVFAKEVDAVVEAGVADLAVHSAKDLPSGDRYELEILAVLKRADARDCLVGGTLAELRPGAKVLTGSVRRRAQLSFLRPDLVFGELRGNVDSRLKKVPSGGAIVLAKAGLDRLGRSEVIAEVLSPSLMLPQAGQGTIAVSGLDADAELVALAASIEDSATRRALDAERSFLGRVGGGCELPVGAYAEEVEGGLRLRAVLASLDGHRLVAEEEVGSDPVALGEAVAERLLVGSGGSGLIDELFGTLEQR